MNDLWLRAVLSIEPKPEEKWHAGMWPLPKLWRACTFDWQPVEYSAEQVLMLLKRLMEKYSVTFAGEEVEIYNPDTDEYYDTIEGETPEEAILKLYVAAFCPVSNPKEEGASMTPLEERVNLEFLCDGTRYKLTLDGKGRALVSFPREISGRWVALVAAEDDAHIKLQQQVREQSQRIAELEQEIVKLRKGETICTKCGLRQDATFEGGDF